MSDATRILQSIDAGDDRAAAALLPLVYEELRRLAAVRMASEKPGQTLQPTALVHEAWLKLVGEPHGWRDSHHFVSAAAEAMRRILVDRARSKKRQKRGGGISAVDLDVMELPAEMEDEKILLVNEALDRFAKEHPDKAEVVKLRYFAAFNHQEIAGMLGLSEKTVMRQWAYAKAWLFEAIRELIRKEG